MTRRFPEIDGDHRAPSPALAAPLPGARGFTVIELLVAAAITAVLATLMIGLTTGVLRGWNRSRGSLTTEGQARLVLDQLSRDLQGALYRHDGNTWLAATVQTTLANSGKPSSVALTGASWDDLRFGAGGVWLRFVTTPLGQDPSAPEAVAYKIAYQPSTAAAGSESHYQLFRLEVPPATTLANGCAVDASPYTTTLAATATDRLIADHVIDFGVRFYVRDATTGALTLTFPADAQGQPSDSDTDYRATASTTSDRFPDVADVMIRILTEDGAQQIRLIDTRDRNVSRPPQFASDAEWWWSVATAHSRVFTRRVLLHASPL